jgi:hypothetical protein
MRRRARADPVGLRRSPESQRSARGWAKVPVLSGRGPPGAGWTLRGHLLRQARSYGRLHVRAASPSHSGGMPLGQRGEVERGIFIRSPTVGKTESH